MARINQNHDMLRKLLSPNSVIRGERCCCLSFPPSHSQTSVKRLTRRRGFSLSGLHLAGIHTLQRTTTEINDEHQEVPNEGTDVKMTKNATSTCRRVPELVCGRVREVFCKDGIGSTKDHLVFLFVFTDLDVLSTPVTRSKQKRNARRPHKTSRKPWYRDMYRFSVATSVPPPNNSYTAVALIVAPASRVSLREMGTLRGSVACFCANKPHPLTSCALCQMALSMPAWDALRTVFPRYKA